MTQIRYAIIDNNRLKKGHSYKIIFETTNYKTFKNYIEQKGLI